MSLLSEVRTESSAGWPSGSMEAVTIVGPGRLETASVPVPEPLPGTVLVAPRHVGICGTDLELFHGTSSYLGDGRAATPLIFGHEWCGRVVSADPGTGWRPGDRVAGQTMVPCGGCARCRAGRRGLCRRMREVGLYGLDGAAAQYIRVPGHALARLPEAVPDRTAALVEPAVTVVESFARTGCGFDDRVAVLGTGTIGLLAVQFARRVAGRVDAVGVDPAGLALAVHCGADRAIPVGETTAGSYSLVVEASGAPEAFAHALDLVEPGGRVGVIGVANEPTAGVVAGSVALRGVSVLGIQHGLDHYDRTIELFATGALTADPLIGATFPAGAAAEAFAFMESARSGPPKVLLDLTEWEGDRRCA
ncbi:2-desacetyl-2-hydroxyethyl bacteriochlorophyllide A dehydrogenase [Actinoplanes campanulatus]|uniref:2-desacetyl-2-hydroxyethyl bacteriochlorophyllide A dehydrogenase n=1 Tax=Actinoplanes campanulatus TaxID=113559 RepID=A0A7W5AIW7_9ACTN|nr:alcohol dehydrogenase catalytic domain-containing protein [Actinoplanes campanulatus]MBB3096922.1 2-desacetyl-2-hydroxyethyl bacteriochlorophyllide A dehydrogenase [Actinoplanes campanulatus]GGN44908.1 alcohol dehydrogenase [Actinoplanes campanulatus]GID37465.1 alcohol dehydrogenase [Actinoplanes campanulatus]